MAAPARPGTLTGFVTAVLSLAVVYTAAAAPVPLFAIYAEALGLGHSSLSWAAVAYFAGAIAALLMFARLSDHLGRRTVILANLVLAAAGCLVFATLSQPFMLPAGRFLQGLACGLASSVLAAYVVDNAPKHPAWLVAAAAGAAPMLGLAAGSLVSGALRQHGAAGGGIFYALMAVMACCALVLPLCPATVTAKPGALRSLAPRIGVPKAVRPLMPAACAVFVGTWSIGGFYLPFSASMAQELLHTSSTLVAGAVFAGMMTPYLAGGSIAGRMEPARAQLFGMTAFALCMVCVVLALGAGSTVLFLAATMLAGTAWGTAFTGTLRRILPLVTGGERAGTLSAVFLISYSGAALPNMLVGRIAQGAGLLDVAAGYAGLAAFCALCVTACALAGSRRAAQAERHAGEPA